MKDNANRQPTLAAHLFRVPNLPTLGRPALEYKLVLPYKNLRSGLGLLLYSPFMPQLNNDTVPFGAGGKVLGCFAEF